MARDSWALMRLPKIQGLIRRRLLVNFRVNADVIQKMLPAPFRPKLHKGYAIAGICLIRLENIRPTWLPEWTGFSSENAAHRIAVLWDEASGTTREGVYIPRRDSNSLLNHITGGLLFRGEHQLADFVVQDDGSRIEMSINSRDKLMSVKLQAGQTEFLPKSSCFTSLDESSAFFEGGSVGYSVTRDRCRLDGIRLQTDGWKVHPLAVDYIESSFFADESKFPTGSVTFDHALIMRNHTHQWIEVPDFYTAKSSSL